MNEVQFSALVCIGFLIIFCLLRIGNQDKKRKTEQDTELTNHENRLRLVEDEKKLSQESRLNLASRVRDMGVEVSNFQDHLAKVRDSVIALNETVSNKRPVVKVMISSELLQEAQKPKTKLKAKGH